MDIPLINKKLLEIYGKDYVNQPIFRIAWTDDLVETAFGIFRDYVPGTNILIREVKEVRLVKKYRSYPSQYVLEKLMVNHHKDEILNSDTLNPSTVVYEPIWCFGKDGKRARQPVWRAVELLIKWNLNPESLSPENMKVEEMKQYEEDEKIMLELLNTDADNRGQSLLGSKIKDGDAVVLSNTDYLVKE